MAPTALRAALHARRLLPILGFILTAGCSDDAPLAPDAIAGAPLAAAAGLDVVSVVALEPFLDAYEDESFAYDVNDLGQVVGTSTRGGSDARRAALWDNSRFPTDLGSLGVYSHADAISADGSVIVGASYDGTTVYAVRWIKPGTDWVLDPLPLPETAEGCTALDVSEDGTIIGGVCSIADSAHAIVWQNGAIQDFGTGRAFAVNSAGQVVGSTLGPSGEALVWNVAGGATPIGTLGGYYSGPEDIDADGSVVGISTNDLGEARPFLWSAKRGMTDLGLLPGTTLGYPRAISGARVVGFSTPSGGNGSLATLWQRGKVVNLGALPGYGSAQARAISPEGRLVAGYSFGSNAIRATLWTLK